MSGMADTYSYDVVNFSEDKYRRMQAADLRLAINSPTGELTRWVLVEGFLDRLSLHFQNILMQSLQSGKKSFAT